MHIEFNAYHPASGEMFEWKDLAIFGEDGRVEHKTQGIFTTEAGDPNKIILLPYSGANDINNKKLFEGDIFKLDNSFRAYLIRQKDMAAFTAFVMMVICTGLFIMGFIEKVNLKKKLTKLFT